MRKKAGDVVVVRVSELGDREDANFHSPKAQLASAKVWSEDEGNRVVAAFEEIDVSGKLPLARRPGLPRAIEMVEAREADHIVVAYFDRLVRLLKVQLGVIDRGRVDRIGLPRHPRGFARLARQRRRDADHPFPGRRQRALQPRGDVPAVLHRPHPIPAKPGREPHGVQGTVVARRNRPLPTTGAGDGVHSDDRVRALVRFHPNHDHVPVPSLNITRRSRSPADTTQSGPLPRSYQVTPAVLGRRRATQRKPVRPTGRQWQRESARRRPRTQPDQPDVTDPSKGSH
jgi:Resolvase, N terminal domain